MHEPYRHKTILLVVNDEHIRDEIEQTIRSSGYGVTVARDCVETRTCLQQFQEQICVVFVDATMHERGIEVLREIRQAHPDVPVIVLSGTTLPSESEEAMQNEATGFLTMPITSERIAKAIRHAVHRRNRDSAEATHAQSAPKSNGAFLCANPRMQSIRVALKRLAVYDVPIVFFGETGVGKEVLARELHSCSPRAVKPFLKLNCAAVPSELLESELFGYERGAFTGALRTKPGKFELADGGTLLMDEIGDMDIRLQAKLLHVLQDSEFQRLGGTDTIRVNVRVLAATHRDLRKEIAQDRFREDLYYRLNVVKIFVPPLRERKDEILLLAKFFLEKHCIKGMRIPEIPDELQNALITYGWPGNVRELENMMRKFLVFKDAELVIRELAAEPRGTDLPLPGEPSPGEDDGNGKEVPILHQVDEARRHAETEAILSALNRVHWNRKKAAAILNVEYKGLLYKMKKLGINGYR